MYGYIYKTTNVLTDEIYIGKKKSSKFKSSYHGSGKEIKKQIKKYGKENFFTELICEAESFEDLNKLEIKYIKYFKEEYNSLCINRAEGGDGGNVFKYASEEDREKFSEKMTKINRKRCRSKEFKQKTGERMKKLYSDPLERQKQSKRIREAWDNDDLKQKHSKKLKEYYRMHPKDCSFNNKKCAMELNDELIVFNSRKELKKYIKDKYQVTFSNPDIKEMLDTGKPYYPFHKNNSKLLKLSGMRLHDFNKV